MGLPLNTIITGKYTSGGEFVNTLTNNPYQGYYYEYNNKTYAGQEYSSTAPEIIKLDSYKYNKLYNSYNTAVYSVSSGVTSQMMSTPPVASLPSTTANNILNRSTRFFYKKYNDNLIKETDENGYKSLQSQPVYQTTFVGTYNGTTQTVDQANQQVPGVKVFLVG